MEKRLALLYDELLKGQIEERPLVEHSPERRAIRGFCSTKGHITVNPIPDVLDTLIHELFHRLHPSWSESTVKRETTKTLKTLSPEEQRMLYSEYLRIRRRSCRQKAVQ